VRACANGVGSRCERRRDGVPACACWWSMGLSTLSESLLLLFPSFFFLMCSYFTIYILSLLLLSVLRLTLPLLTPRHRNNRFKSLDACCAPPVRLASRSRVLPAPVASSKWPIFTRFPHPSSPTRVAISNKRRSRSARLSELIRSVTSPLYFLEKLPHLSLHQRLGPSTRAPLLPGEFLNLLEPRSCAHETAGLLRWGSRPIPSRPRQFSLETQETHHD
jgi:hypothetical protein